MTDEVETRPVEDPHLTQRKALNAALAKAQGEFKPITKTSTVNVKTREGGVYEFHYAPLDTILGAVRDALVNNELALIQLLEDNGKPAIRTELRHAGGGVLGSSFPLPSVPATPQQLGSLLTYLRRYTITALLGIAAEEDDDAQQAQQAAEGTPSEPKPKTSGLKLASDKQVGLMHQLVRDLDKAVTPVPQDYADAAKGFEGAAEGWESVLKARLREEYKVGTRAALTTKQASELIDWLEAQKIPF